MVRSAPAGPIKVHRTAKTGPRFVTGFRQPSEGDAVGGRSTPRLFNVLGAPVPTLTDSGWIAAVRSALGAVQPWQAPVNLINFVGRANDADAVLHSWTAGRNDRLDSVRAKHDPDGLSRTGDMACQRPRSD